jgi:hypothetical protein
MSYIIHTIDIDTHLRIRRLTYRKRIDINKCSCLSVFPTEHFDLLVYLDHYNTNKTYRSFIYLSKEKNFLYIHASFNQLEI